MAMVTTSLLPFSERRRYPRYYIASRVTMAVEDNTLHESLGLGEAGDISLGGIRVVKLPACQNVKVGDSLGLLLLDAEDALSLEGEVVHHGTPDTFGVEFRNISDSELVAIRQLISRQHSAFELAE